MSVEAAASVLARLADGARHDTRALAAALGLGAAELTAAFALLESAGAALERSQDQHVRLAPPTDWLDARAITGGLEPAAARAIELDLRLAAASTNDILLERAAPSPGSMPVCLAEFQHGGRGRRGRRWIAPPGGTLCLSAAWAFPGPPRDLSALSLVIGVAVVRALAAATGLEAGVKWPNDIVCDERKLGGVLVEARADSGRTWAVAGIGLNVCVAAEQLRQMSDWPGGAIDMATAIGAVPPPRSRLAAALLNELWRAYVAFAERGFEPFIEDWRAAHVLQGRPAVLHGGGDELAGVVRGIDADGALLLETDGELRRILSGEVSLRPAT